MALILIQTKTAIIPVTPRDLLPTLLEILKDHCHPLRIHSVPEQDAYVFATIKKIHSEHRQYARQFGLEVVRLRNRINTEDVLFTYLEHLLDDDPLYVAEIVVRIHARNGNSFPEHFIPTLRHRLRTYKMINLGFNAKAVSALLLMLPG